jgi:hypothetical protein
MKLLLTVGSASLLSCLLAVWIGYRHRTFHPRDPELDKLERAVLDSLASFKVASDGAARGP